MPQKKWVIDPSAPLVKPNEIADEPLPDTGVSDKYLASLINPAVSALVKARYHRDSVTTAPYACVNSDKIVGIVLETLGLKYVSKGNNDVVNLVNGRLRSMIDYKKIQAEFETLGWVVVIDNYVSDYSNKHMVFYKPRGVSSEVPPHG